METKAIPIEEIKGVYFERSAVDREKLSETAATIKDKGIIQPIVVRKFNGDYQVVAGYLRYLAAKEAGIKEIPATVYEKMPDTDAIRICLIENIQRQEMNPLDEAQLLKLLCNAGIPQIEIAQQVGKSPAWVSQLLALLEDPEPIKKAIVEGAISEAHARVLRGVPEAKLREAVREAKGLTVPQVRVVVKEKKEEFGAEAAEEKAKTGIAEAKEKLEQIKEAKKRKTELEKELGEHEKAMKINIKDKEMAELVTKLSEIENSYMPLTAQLETLEATKAQISNDLKAFDFNTTTAELEEATKKKDSLDKEITKIGEQLRKLRDERKDIEALAAQYEEQLKDFDRKRKQYDEIKEKIEQFNDRRREIEKKYSEIGDFQNLKKKAQKYDKVLEQRKETFRKIAETKRELRSLQGVINSESGLKEKIKGLKAQA